MFDQRNSRRKHSSGKEENVGLPMLGRDGTICRLRYIYSLAGPWEISKFQGRPFDAAGGTRWHSLHSYPIPIKFDRD